MKGKFTLSIESVVVKHANEVTFEGKGVKLEFESEADAPSLKAVCDYYVQALKSFLQ